SLDPSPCSRGCSTTSDAGFSRVLPSARRQYLPDGLQEALDTDRLRLVAVEARGPDLAAGLRQRGGRPRDDRDRGGGGIGAQPLQSLDPVHTRELDVHEDQGRPLFSGHAQTVLLLLLSATGLPGG